MKKSIESLVAKLQQNSDGLVTGGFGGIRGGAIKKKIKTNSGICNNSVSCNGSNSGYCSNAGNCNGSTNPVTCQNAGTCIPN